MVKDDCRSSSKRISTKALVSEVVQQEQQIPEQMSLRLHDPLKATMIKAVSY